MILAIDLARSCGPIAVRRRSCPTTRTGSRGATPRDLESALRWCTSIPPRPTAIRRLRLMRAGCASLQPDGEPRGCVRRARPSMREGPLLRAASALRIWVASAKSGCALLAARFKNPPTSPSFSGAFTVDHLTPLLTRTGVAPVNRKGGVTGRDMHREFRRWCCTDGEEGQEPRTRRRSCSSQYRSRRAGDTSAARRDHILQSRLRDVLRRSWAYVFCWRRLLRYFAAAWLGTTTYSLGARRRTPIDSPRVRTSSRAPHADLNTECRWSRRPRSASSNIGAADWLLAELPAGEHCSAGPTPDLQRASAPSRCPKTTSTQPAQIFPRNATPSSH